MKVALLICLVGLCVGRPLGEVELASPKLQSDFSDFWLGVYVGMQKAAQPDTCVTQISQAIGLYSTAIDSFFGAFTGVDPSLILTSIQTIDQAFNSLVRAVELCQLKTLAHNVINIFNREGFGKALINLSVNMNQVLVRLTQVFWGYIWVDLRNGLYRNVGNSVGELLSITLAYEF